MNKLSYLMMGFAALSFAACSSDEPTPAPTPDNGDGSTMYLNINITDANSSRSRAQGVGDDFNPDGTTSNDPVNDGYEYGSADEHKVTTAEFLFFDGDGNYVTRAQVWKNGGNGTDANVEYFGANTLVLRNLKKGFLPEYLITVLNAPAKDNLSFGEQVERNKWTMTQTRSQQIAIRNAGGNFVMSTTSFFNGPKTDTDRYDDEHYYATKLKTTDFLTEPVESVNNTDAVEVYVERLAAKFSIKLPGAGETFPVDVTIAGLDNDGGSDNENVELPSGSEKVYVRIDGWGLTGYEKTSFVSKDLTNDNFNKENLWSTWNKPEYFRSFWGASVSYGNANPDLAYTTWGAANAKATEDLYSYETTNTVANISNENKTLINKNVTSYIFTATVCSDAEGTSPLELIEYNGVYFKPEQYKNYVLGNLQQSGKLEIYKNAQQNSVTTEDGGTKTEWSADPVSDSDFITVQPTGAATGEIVINVKPGVTFYKKATEGSETKYVVVEAETINETLASFNNQTKAFQFTNGAMYYSVPVKHLVALSNDNKDKSPYVVEAEGNYGVVRNHWYQLNVDKVFRLGHGVFNPDGDNGEELVPGDDSEETFALAAKINILSWKIVQQNTEL